VKTDMKTIESLIIRRKLATFRSVFPHDDDTTVQNITGIYNDVLEFSKSISPSFLPKLILIASLLDPIYIPNP
jgi:hypothetical protein